MTSFQFGLEAEFLLARKSDWTPLWHRDITFDKLNSLFESISLQGIPSLQGLELEPPHRKLMPFVVEGYHVPNHDFESVNILPKGVEIRTPVTSSLDACLNSFEVLMNRLQGALAREDMAAVALSHHPIECQFSGPQNKRRHDYWQWAMEVMTTYGPDINVGLPNEMRSDFDEADLQMKLDYYSPALAALSVGSPFLRGEPWKIRDRVGKSFRMYKRSIIAPAIEIHPDEDWRLEFKIFDMPASTSEFRAFFLCFLGLLLTPQLKGRASRHSRVYDLGQVARLGLEAETVAERLNEFFEFVPSELRVWGFDPSALEILEERLAKLETPADGMLKTFEREKDLRMILQERADFHFEHPRSISEAPFRQHPLIPIPLDT